MTKLREVIKSEEEKMTFNEKLIRLRKINSLTQDEFAKSVGVSRQAVYKWESGQSFPEVPTLLQIKALFSVSIDDLLDESFEIALPEKKTRRRVRKPVAQTEKVAGSEESMVTLEEVNVPEEAAEDSSKNVGMDDMPKYEATENDSSLSEEKTETAVAENNNDAVTPKKKIGLFGRLFGRR